MKNLIDYIATKDLIKPFMEKEIKSKRFILHGAKAMNKQARFPFQRATDDYDLFSKNPKKDARILTRKLNKLRREEYNFVKKGKHQTTYKIRDVGLDLEKNTKDDFNIADITKTPKNLKAKKLNNLNVMDIKEILKRKEKILKNPRYTNRFEKDREDIARIKAMFSL